VGQVGEGLQQDLGSDRGLKEGWVELVPEKGNKRRDNVVTPGPQDSPFSRQVAAALV
jgi:hypothetical protein